MLRLIQLLCDLGAACLHVPLAQWSPNPAGAGQTLYFSCILWVMRAEHTHGMGMKHVASVAGTVTQSYPLPNTALHQHDRCAPGWGLPWPQGIIAHTGGMVPSASSGHPKSIPHQAGSCGLRTSLCGYGCNPYPDTGVLANCSKLNRNPKNSAKCCSERSGRKLEAHRPYGFVGRDGCPQGHLAEGTCLMPPRQSCAE